MDEKNFIKQIDSIDYTDQLYNELCGIINDHNINHLSQISLTSLEGNDDWEQFNGKITDLKFPEKYSQIVNESLKGTNIEKLINKYSNFYRWRAMKISPKSTYTIHKDGNGQFTNTRIHIPIKTNENCYMLFFGQNKNNNTPFMYHLEIGNVYEVNTTDYHSAVNFDMNSERWHIVGVKYENSNYWT